MPVQNATWYYKYRQFVNCQGGGYLEDYNLNGGTGIPPTLPAQGVLNVVKWILCLRGQLLEGNSKIANGEISVETVPGVNPPEGFQIPHAVPNSSPILLPDPTTGTLETQVQVANDPEQCIAYRLNVGTGTSELRTLRSIRASWVNQWEVLYSNIVAQLGIMGAQPGPNLTLAPAFPVGLTNPAQYIAYFLLLLRANTNFVQYTPNPRSVLGFSLLPFLAPNSSGSPAVANPILVPQLARRKVGEGWPKTRGKMQTFGTHG
jgi:hypothetical protein